MKVEKELPGELNKKLKRVKSSRDNLKECNREKAQQNKKLRDRNVEIAVSRDKWKSRTKELEKELERERNELKLQIEAATQAAAKEKNRADKESERAERLQAENEEVKKKFKMLSA